MVKPRIDPDDGSVSTRGLRSSSSRKYSFVTFLNKTSRDVDVIWINFDGIRVKYQTLGPNKFCDVNTFVNHPWIFRDSKSQAKLTADYQEVYNPRHWLEVLGFSCHQPLPSTLKPKRVTVNITIPVYPLKNRCLEIVKMQLKEREDALKLDIPRALQQELLKPLA